MRHFGLLLILLAASSAQATSDAALLKDLVARYPGFSWSATRLVKGDLNRDGKLDNAALGIGTRKVALALLLNGKNPVLTEIAAEAGKQFGICLGAEPKITIQLQSEAPLNALGETPQGYEICAKCIEIVVSGGDCDPLQFYWNTKSKKLVWWRA
jgi:hypothetical protein